MVSTPAALMAVYSVYGEAAHRRRSHIGETCRGLSYTTIILNKRKVLELRYRNTPDEFFNAGEVNIMMIHLPLQSNAIGLGCILFQRQKISANHWVEEMGQGIAGHH